MPKLEQLRVVHRRLANGALDRQDVGDLRSDVEVEELERRLHLRFAQDFDRFEDFCSRKAELRVLAAGCRPLARALGQKPHADSDPRHDVHLGRDFRDRAQLRQFLGDQDDLLVEFAPEHRHPDVGRVFVAIADDQRFGIVVHGQTGVDLGFRADLQTVVERLAGIEDLFHDFAELVDLDRKNAAIDAFVVVVGDRFVERGVEKLDAMAQQILKSNEKRRLEIQRLRVVERIDDRNRDTVFLQRCDCQIAVRVDAEIAGAPSVDHVQRRGVVDRPLVMFVKELRVRFHCAEE